MNNKVILKRPNSQNEPAQTPPACVTISFPSAGEILLTLHQGLRFSLTTCWKWAASLRKAPCWSTDRCVQHERCTRQVGISSGALLGGQRGSLGGFSWPPIAASSPFRSLIDPGCQQAGTPMAELGCWGRWERSVLQMGCWAFRPGVSLHSCPALVSSSFSLTSLQPCSLVQWHEPAAEPWASQRRSRFRSLVLVL